MSACSTTEEGPKNLTEKDFYDTAQRQLDANRWDLSIQNLQALEENFPFGTYAEQAQLELIYAYYHSQDFEAATAAADRFIRLHPQHRNVDYAYYMKGLAAFNQSRSFFERFLPTDQSKRDPGAARDSFAHFSQLLARYPNSTYAPDAKKRMIYLRNLLARAEIHAANYLFKRGAYVAAINRGRYVLENFQQTPAVPDALAILIQGYHLLELDDLADNSLATLHQNYPEYPALDQNGAFNYQFSRGSDERSMVNIVSFGLFEKNELQGFDTREVYNPMHRQTQQTVTEAAQQAEQRSWANRLSFGLFD